MNDTKDTISTPETEHVCGDNCEHDHTVEIPQDSRMSKRVRAFFRDYHAIITVEATRHGQHQTWAMHFGLLCWLYGGVAIARKPESVRHLLQKDPGPVDLTPGFEQRVCPPGFEALAEVLTAAGALDFVDFSGHKAKGEMIDGEMMMSGESINAALTSEYYLWESELSKREQGYAQSLIQQVNASGMSQEDIPQVLAEMFGGADEAEAPKGLLDAQGKPLSENG